MGFKLGSESRKARNSENTPIFRKKLDKGVLGEANMDGSIFIYKSVKKGSEQEKSVIRHEGQHAKEMASGKLSYADGHVRYNEKTYARKDGKIKYNGKWIAEGSKEFPWEKSAYKQN